MTALSIPDLTTLDPNAVAQNVSQNTELLQELAPELDLQLSALQDLVVYYGSILETADQTVAEQIQAVSSPLQLAANPALVNATTLANFFSRYGITPNVGAAAQGAITIVVSANTTVSIAQGALFDADGQQFQSVASYVAKIEASQINNATDVLLTPLLNGQFAFTISVTAVNVGALGNVSINTPFIPEVEPNNFLAAYASSDFTEGLDPQTLTSLLSQLQEGIAAQVVSDRPNMMAELHSNEAFPTTLDSSVIGLGDPEMLRDAHSIFPVHFGGRVDWYVRTQPQVQQLLLSVTATLIEIQPNGQGVWQFPITRDMAPGYYELRTIQLPSDTNVVGSFPVLSETRSLDLSPTGSLIPDMANLTEGVYTRFQASTVQFVDTVTATTDLAVGATATYAAVVALMPLIDQVQDYFGSRSHRNTMSDLLVKAPVPCFVQLSFTINQSSADIPPDVAAIQAALSVRVAQVSFAGVLNAGVLQSTIAGLLSADMTVSQIQMLGRIARPDGQDQTIFSTEQLVVPNLPAVMTTPNTVLFFLDPHDVAITVNTSIPTAL